MFFLCFFCFCSSCCCCCFCFFYLPFINLFICARRCSFPSFVWFLNVTFYGLLIKTHRPTLTHTCPHFRHTHSHRYAFTALDRQLYALRHTHAYLTYPCLCAMCVASCCFGPMSIINLFVCSDLRLH